MTATDADRPLVDVRDMIVVHTAMLREFRLAPAAVLHTAAGNARQATVVGDHLRFVCELLHHHHAGEDELLWPKLRARTEPSAHRVIDEVEAQHDDLDASLGRVEARRTAWVGDPDAPHRDRLAAELDTLHDLLCTHLELEERSLLPLAAKVLTDREWQEIGAAGAAAMDRSVLPLVFGMFAYEGDRAVIAQMLQQAPLVPRTLLPLIAPRVYARRARRVHGTTRP